MNEKNIDLFENTSVPKAVMTNLVPAILAMLMSLVYNLADTFFIGQTHNDLQVAAISLTAPIFIIYMALGDIFGVGGTSLISRAIGSGKKEYAKRVSSFCVWGSVAVGIFLSICIWTFMNPIMQVLGASSETVPYVRSFLTIFAFGGPFVMISNCCSNIIRADGKPKIAMMGTILGNILNIILDGVLILLCGLGIKGAAIATVIGNLCAATFYICYLRSKKTMLSLRLKDFMIRDKVFTGVVSIGIPASLSFILMSVSQVVINNQLSRYGDMEVAAFGVAVKVLMIISTIAIGAGQGIQPLLAYCVGSRNEKRFHAIERFSAILATGICLVLTLLCFIFAGPIVNVFLTDKSAYNFGVTFTGILLTTGWIFGLHYVLVNALQAMGAVTPSLIVNVSRQGLIYIPAMFIMQVIFGMNGLVWAQPVTDVLSVTLAAILYWKTVRKCFKQDDIPTIIQ